MAPTLGSSAASLTVFAELPIFSQAVSASPASLSEGTPSASTCLVRVIHMTDLQQTVERLLLQRQFVRRLPHMPGELGTTAALRETRDRRELAQKSRADSLPCPPTFITSIRREQITINGYKQRYKITRKKNAHTPT